MKYIIVRIDTKVWVLFEKDFINHNEFQTENLLNEVLGLLYPKNSFEVGLYYRNLESGE